MDLRSYQHIVVLTGAGISAESGVSTFRDSNGLWENHRIEDVATPEAFIKNPHLVWKFYSLRRIQAGQVKPNAAHWALVNFAKAHPGRLDLITQNVDLLHERADPEEVLPPVTMHGALNRTRCSQCETLYYDDFAYFAEDGKFKQQGTSLCTETQKKSTEYLHQYRISFKDGLPLSPCCQSYLRPHIVWFGEMPLYMDKIERLLSRADLFVSIGTSGQVYPAAGFLQAAKRNGAVTVCQNLEEIPHSQWIDHFLPGKATLETTRLFQL